MNLTYADMSSVLASHTLTACLYLGTEGKWHILNVTKVKKYVLELTYHVFINAFVKKSVPLYDYVFHLTNVI